MSNPDASSFSVSYAVPFDLEAHRRVSKAAIRAQAGRWFSAAFRYALFMGFAGYVTAALAFSLRASQGESRAILVAGVGAFALALLHYGLLVNHRLQSDGVNEVDRQWTCTIADEGWSFHDERGLARSYPWKQMKIEFEHAEGWLIKCGNETLVVYRKPMADAGLEAEFRKRLAPRDA